LFNFFFYILPEKKGAEDTRKRGRGEEEKGGERKRFFWGKTHFLANFSFLNDDS
jgi:hypothetical protein